MHEGILLDWAGFTNTMGNNSALRFRTLEVLTQLYQKEVFSLKIQWPLPGGKVPILFADSSRKNLNFLSVSGCNILSCIQHLLNTHCTWDIFSDTLVQPCKYSILLVWSWSGSMLTVPTSFVRGKGDGGKQRPHYLLISHEPRACSAETQAHSKPPEGLSMITQQAHPFYFVPKGAAGSTSHSKT